MSIERSDFDAVSEDDLQTLVQAGVPEGPRLEFKQETYGNSEKQKKEFLKDVSALANSQGGHLVLGVEESDGVATAITALGVTDADKELLRLEQLARAGLEPHVSGLKMKAIPIHSGGHVLLVRVPRSWNSPHRVKAQGDNRFYARHSTGVYQPDVQELKGMFNDAASALEHARSFRDERITEIQTNTDENRLAGGGRLILHVLPVAALSGRTMVDLEQIKSMRTDFRTISQSSTMSAFNYYGYINQDSVDRNTGYTQVFRDGKIEATLSGLVDERDQSRYINSVYLERSFFSIFPKYIDGLKALGVPPPLIVLLTIEGVRHSRYKIGFQPWDDEPLIPEDVLRLPACMIENYGDETDYHRAVKPMFDTLWNAAGYPGCANFDDEGRWVGRAR